MKPGFFQGKKFPFTPKRRKKSLGSQCNNIIDTRHDLAAFRSKLANVSWLRSYTYVGLLEKWNEAAQAVHQGSVAGMRLAHHGNSREILQSRGMQPCNHAFETLHHISTLAFRRANR